MEELLGVVAEEVRAIGVDASSHRGAFPPGDGNEVFVVVPHEYFVLTDIESHPDAATLRRTIAFCVEHPGNAVEPLVVAVPARPHPADERPVGSQPPG